MKSRNVDGNITNLGDLPDYFNKDYTSGDSIMAMANGIYKSGNPLNNSTRMMYENKLYQMIEKGGIPTLKSLARDDFFNRGGIPSITDEELNDPMQRDAVEKKLVDFYMGVFNTHAKNGAANRVANNGGRSEKQDDKEYYSEEVNSWLDTELPNLPMNSADDLLTAWEQSGVLGDFIMGDDGAGGFILKSRYGRGKYINVSTFPKTDHAKFLAILKRNGIK